MFRIVVVIACLLVGVQADTFCLPPYQTTQCSTGQKCPDQRPCPIDLPPQHYIPPNLPNPPEYTYIPPPPTPIVPINPNPGLVIDLPFLPPIVIGAGSPIPPPPQPQVPTYPLPSPYLPPGPISPAPTCYGNFNWGITQSTGYWPHCVTFPSSYGNYPITSCGYYSNGSPTTLYAQSCNDRGDIGYGLYYHPSTYNGFIQLDFTQVYAATSSLANIQISTYNTYGSKWYVYGSNTAGDLGTNLLLSGTFELNLANIPGFSVYKYISIQVAVSNIFITQIRAPCPTYYPPYPQVPPPVTKPTASPIYTPPPPPPPSCSGLLNYALTIATGVLPSQVAFYPTNGIFPVTINGFLTNGARTQLYAQATNPDETGLGLLANPYGCWKLWPGAFIQLDFTALYAIPTRPPSFQFSLSSVDYGDSWSIYGSNTLGVLGHELLLSGNCEPNFNTLPGYGTYKYISIIATSGNILLSKLQGVCPPPPAPQVSYHCNCPFYQGSSVQCAYNPDNRINQLCPGQTPCPNCRAATSHSTKDLEKAEKAHADKKAEAAAAKHEETFTESTTKHEEEKE